MWQPSLKTRTLLKLAVSEAHLAYTDYVRGQELASGGRPVIGIG